MKQLFSLKKDSGMNQSPPFYHIPKSLCFSVSFMITLLLPVYFFSIGYFGYKIAILTTLTIIIGFFIEYYGNRITRRRSGYYGVSVWIVFPLLTPQAMPLELSLVSFILSILITQSLFGGYGRQIYHPAVVAQIFLMINSWATYHSSFTEPFQKFGFGFSFFSSLSVTDRTALSILKNGGSFGLLGNFLGPNVGLFSDSFPIVVLFSGMVFLLSKETNRLTPVSFLFSYFCLSVIGQHIFPSHRGSPLHGIVAGGILFYTFFIFSDPFTTPKGFLGRIFFGISAACITLIIRLFSSNNEGVMYSAVFNYSFAPLYDQIGYKLSSFFFSLAHSIKRLKNDHPFH